MITERETLASQLQAAYPQGLTGIFISGTTRRQYLYERGDSSDGRITDFSDYVDYMLRKVLELARLFYAYGGRHFITPLFWWNAFESRGSELARMYRDFGGNLVKGMAQAFYEEEKVTPIFLGLDTWLAMPPD